MIRPQTDVPPKITVIGPQTRCRRCKTWFFISTDLSWRLCEACDSPYSGALSLPEHNEHGTLSLSKGVK